MLAPQRPHLGRALELDGDLPRHAARRCLAAEAADAAAAVDAFHVALKAGDTAGAWASVTGNSYQRQLAVSKDLEELVALNNAGAQTASDEADVLYAHARNSVLGALGVFDDEPRTLSPRDVMLLGHMADEVMQAARQQAAKAPDAAPPAAS